MKTQELTDDDLKKAIEALRSAESTHFYEAKYLLSTVSNKVLNKNRYKGSGRPRKGDYDYHEIDWYNVLGSS